VGASSNIIEASQHALVDAIEYGLRQLGAVPPEVGPRVERSEGARARAMEAR
jgi:hypothetical protein